jgi:flagellar hook-associated protein 3 FlgL
MRITNYMTQLAALRDIQSRQAAVAASQQQLITGRRIQTLSDDPIGASQVMQFEGTLRDVSQYRRNGTWATTRMGVEDAALTSTRDVLQQAKALTVSGATSSPTDPLRLNALAQVAQLRDQVLAMANTKVGDEYIFGGAQTGQPPFPPSGTYAGDTVVRNVQMDQGLLLPTNHTGDQVFAPVLAALDSLAQELTSGTPTTITAQFAVLDSANQVALGAQAELGSRMAEIQSADQALGTRAGQLLGRRDALRDVDPAEAAVKALSAQSSLERAYTAIGKILSTSLMDFLK